MRKTALLLSVVLLLSVRVAVGQTTGPYALDKVATATGLGNPAIDSVTPSQPNELAILVTGADYSGGWCANSEISRLTGMSAPWVFAGTGGDGGSFAPNPNGPFYIGPPTYSYGPGAPPDYPFWTLTSGPISASGTTLQASCYTTSWTAALALFRYVGTQLPVAPVARFTAAGYGNGTTTFSGWGLGYAPAGPLFLIGYLWTQGVGPNGGSNCNEGPYITPAVKLTDPVGNKYQVIADITSSRVNNINNCDQATGNRLVMFMVPDFKGANGANTLTISKAGGDPSISNAVYIAAVVYQKPPMPSMVDPITDDSPSTSLLDGPNVTSDSHRLATAGRLVQGVAADGVTEVVVRIPTTSVGDQVSVTLMNDQSAQSGSVDDDGGLGQVGGTTFTQSQINVSAVDTSGQGPFAFVIYRAPVDFARSSGADNGLAQRSVSLQIQNLTQRTTTTLPITVLRPPLILIHGLWDGWRTWDHFNPLSTGPGSGDPRFSIYRVNYDNSIGERIGLTDPVYPLEQRRNISENSLGLAYNAQKNAIPQALLSIRDFKSGLNPGNIPVADVQADIVAHSMGGLIARAMVLQPGFIRDNNFGQGTIHKVITVDTPHLGSQLASQLLAQQENGGCFQQQILGPRGMFALSSLLFFDNSSAIGAVADMEGDDTTNQLSGILALLKSSSPHPIPISFLTGIYQNFASLDSSPIAAIIRTICGVSGDPLAQQLTSTAYPTIFHNNPNDAIVSENSQLNGLIPSPNSQFFGLLHSAGVTDLGFLPPNSVMDGGAVPTEVIFLLNTSWKNSVYYNVTNP